MNYKIINLLLCFSFLSSCNYFQEKKAKDDAEKREIARREQNAIAKQKAIEEQEAKRLDMKNDIAKYVYIKDSYLFNNTDYTIDEVIISYFYSGRKFVDTGDGGLIDKYVQETGEEKHTYIAAHSKILVLRNGNVNKGIISIKCKALELN